MKNYGIFGLFLKKSSFISHRGEIKNCLKRDIGKEAGVIVHLRGSNCINESLELGRSYYQRDVDIMNCFFSRVSKLTGSGGVVCVEGGAFNMFVAYTMFYNCISTSLGGAISFNSLNSKLRMICANKCYSERGLFVNSYSNNDNNAEFISISHCVNSNTGNYPIRLEKGNQVVNNINCSRNSVLYCSSLGFISPLMLKCTFCTITYNLASGTFSTYIHNCSGNLFSMNFVRNNSPGGYGVIGTKLGFPRIHFSIFIMNENVLFHTETGSLDISHCFIYHIGLTSTGFNNSFIFSQTYLIDHFSSYFCYAEKAYFDRNNPHSLIEPPKRGVVFHLTLIFLCLYS